MFSLNAQNPMPNFYYTDANGQKQGLVTPQQLKDLVAQGVIKPDTELETDNGHKGFARQIKELFPKPPTAPVPEAKQAMVPSAPKLSDATMEYVQQKGYDDWIDDDYERIARAHRLSTLSIWLYILGAPFGFVTIVLMLLSSMGVNEINYISFGVGLFFWGFGLILGALCFSIVCMTRLARLLHYGGGSIGLLVLCILFGLPMSIFRLMEIRDSMGDISFWIGSHIGSQILGLIPLFLVYFRAGSICNQGNDMWKTHKIPKFAPWSRWAIVAGYIGLFAVLVYPAPIALILGIFAFRDCNNRSLEGKGLAIFAIVMGAVFSLFILFSVFGGMLASADTKTYQDKEYGFSFRYPDGWQGAIRPKDMPSVLVLVAGQVVDDLAPNVQVIAIPAEPDISNEDLLEISKEVFQRDVLEAGGFSNVLIKDYGIKEIGGKKCLFCHFQATMGRSDMSIEFLQFNFLHKDKEFLVQVMDFPTRFDKNRPDFDSIINSFRFD
jgi:hypothetical protein